MGLSPQPTRVQPGKVRRRRRLNLGRTLVALPNLLTLGNIFCGFNAIRIVAQDNPSVDDFYTAAILLLFAMLFDLLDGRVARLTRTESAFGLQLDSLADVVSFGVTPAILIYKWVLYRHPIPGLLTAFLFVACAAIRLARFNVLTSNPSGGHAKPGKYMIGLPTPPASGILISLLVANHAVGGAIGAERYTLTLFAVMIVLSLLMVSNVRFRSFKDLRLNAATLALVFFIVASSAFIWRNYRPQFVLAWLLLVYISIGVVESARLLFQHLMRRRDSVHSIERPERT